MKIETTSSLSNNFFNFSFNFFFIFK
jgi:hypothetical protein